MRVPAPPCSPHRQKPISRQSKAPQPPTSRAGYRTPSSSFARTLSVGLSLSLSVALGGCASSYQWVKDGFSAPHANAKFAACQLEAERLRFSTSEPDEDRADRILHEARLCMKANGWRWVQTDTLESSEEPGEEPKRSTSPSSADDSGSAQPSEPASTKSDDDKSEEKPSDKTDQKDDDDDDDDDD